MIIKIALDFTNIWTDVLDFVGKAWWVEVFTTQPKCIYYFGPFANSKEAQTSIEGYVQDLETESAQGIHARIKQCRPEQLTIEDTTSAN